MKKCLVWLLACFLAANVFSEDVVAAGVIELYEAHTINNMPYRLLRPLNFDSTQKYPVIVSLHGKGGTGTDNVRQLQQLPGILAEEKNRKDYPCYVLAPQSEKLWNAESLVNLKKVISDLPSVDHDRIYMTGHSMGGLGVYLLAQLDPGYFAAAAPAAGSGLGKGESFINESLAKDLKDLPIWAFHGNKDTKCPIEKDQKIFADMKLIGGNMKFTTWAGDGHGGQVALKMVAGSGNATTEMSNDRCDPEPVFMKWLFAQKRAAK